MFDEVYGTHIMDSLFQKIKICLGVLLISIIPLLGIILFSFTNKLSSAIFLFCIVVLSIGTGFLLIKYYDSHIVKKRNKEKEKRNTELRQKGRLKKVHYENLLIGSRSELKEIIPLYYTSRMQTLDGLIGIERDKKLKNSEYSVIIYKEKMDYQEQVYISSEINKDTKTLTFKILKQETIDLYIDPLNKENYFFDLDFLEA
ncbi:MAG: hypothetical protein MH137_12760 [Flavobacteriales bacterium]|nr:hypothetical protein [Flavobacteriales bacterium]